MVASGYSGVAALALIFSVIGSYYYIRVVKVMYFEEPLHPNDQVVVNHQEAQVMFSLHGLAALVFGLFPGVLINLCSSVV